MLYQSTPLNLLLMAVVFVTVVLSSLFAETMASLRYVFLGLSMLLIGIPHGAIDHIISSKIYDLQATFRDQFKFYFAYLAIMLLMALIWVINGLAGFIIFVIITLYHFGQADLEHLKLPNRYHIPLILSRGIMILSLIIFIDLSFTYPVIETATGAGVESFPWILENGFLVGMALAAQHPVFSGIVMYAFKDKQPIPWYYPAADSLLLMILFATSDPIISFSIYFALWHSMGHVVEMKEFFHSIGESFSITKFYKMAFPFTLISFIGLGGIYYLNRALGIEEQMVALLFILISVLTLPHVIVVQKMLDAKAKPS